MQKAIYESMPVYDKVSESEWVSEWVSEKAYDYDCLFSSLSLSVWFGSVVALAGYAVQPIKSASAHHQSDEWTCGANKVCQQHSTVLDTAFHFHSLLLFPFFFVSFGQCHKCHFGSFYSVDGGSGGDGGDGDGDGDGDGGDAVKSVNAVSEYSEAVRYQMEK